MNRQQVVEFIFKEAERLNNEEHVVDLAKAGRFEELAAIGCETTREVIEGMSTTYLKLTNENIKEGHCTPIVIWLFTLITDENDEMFFGDEEVTKFAHRLALEAGKWGKSVAFLILEGEDLCDMNSEEFFSDEYAADYDKKYGEDDDEEEVSEDKSDDEDVAEEKSEE